MQTQGESTSSAAPAEPRVEASSPEGGSPGGLAAFVQAHVGPRRRYLLIYVASLSVGSGLLAVVFRRQAAGVGAAWLLAVTLAWFVARLSSRSLRQRLHRLREAADAIGRGELHHRIDLHGHDDFVKLAQALDSMAARIETQLAERVALQKDLARAEKLACLGELAATVAHEVNNPLDGLQNAVRILGAAHGGDERTRRLLELMEAGLGRIELLVRRLMGLARSDPPRLEPLRVEEALDDALLFAQPRLNRHGIRVVREFPPDLPTVLADRPQFVQVLINLLLNAADAMPAGGRITISARGGHADGPVALTVADTGSGISPEHLPHIFEPFYTTKKPGEGNGLGLAVVARIIEAHRGRIRVESRVETGTTFEIELPRAQRAHV
ncbi:MAG: HAMP domain-containing protein [Phycisphaerae bacterium]|jgi:signal transduction histidine kinase